MLLVRPHVEVWVISTTLFVAAVYAVLVLDSEVWGDEGRVLVLLGADQAVLH